MNAGNGGIVDISVVNEDELRVLVADILDVDEDEITNDAHFIDDLGVDSVMALEVSVVLEKRYQVKITESDLRRISSIRSVVGMLREKSSTR